MNYAASVSDFFKSPHWMKNMLLGGVCMLIPILGPIVVMGWLVTGFWARRDESWEAFPPFEFSQFDKYLDRGLWPFLVTFVASLVITPVMFVMMIPLMIGQAAFAGNQSEAGGCLFGVLALFMMLLAFVLMFALMLMSVPLTVTTPVKEGKLRALATTGRQRTAVYPDTPTVAETGLPGYFWESWGGMFAPARTPRPIIDKLNRALLTAFKMPDVQSRYATLGVDASPMAPAEFDRFVDAEITRVGELARRVGIKPQ